MLIYLNRRIVNLTVPTLLVLVLTLRVFFNPWIFDQMAVMNCSMIKSGPPDSSDGPDLICLSQTHDPYF